VRDLFLASKSTTRYGSAPSGNVLLIGTVGGLRIIAEKSVKKNAAAR
jgi:hypothetical protein